MVARLRHIALNVPDPEKAAKFFEEAFGMTRAGPAGLGLYMTDGTINVALLKFPGDVPGYAPGEKAQGLIHFGMWVDDLDEAAEKVTKAGGKYLTGRADKNPNTYYEVKYTDPNGVVFDMTHSGWKGAVKEVEPAKAGNKAAAE
ncbi:MAG: VOC family protein [Hyphomicrobiaceae bacterium]